MWSIGIWKPMDRKFGLRPWLSESITIRCGLMFGLGMRLPRKSRVNTRTLHARVLWVCVIGFCEVCLHAWLCIT